MNTYHDIERMEIRLRRLETRLCKLMIHLGMDPQTNEPLNHPKDYVDESWLQKLVNWPSKEPKP
jgi:hypothetical protein